MIEEPTSLTSSPARSKRRPRLGRWIMGGIALVLLLVIGAAWAVVQRSGMMQGIVDAAIFKVPPREVFQRDTMTVLLLGADKEYYYKGLQELRSANLTDMILVAKFDFAAQKVTGVSIPRDIYWKSRKWGNHKVNAFYKKEGQQAMQEVVQDMLGIEIDRTILLKLDAFQEMVDLVGGVEIDVQRDMYYEDKGSRLLIDLKKGLQVLNGEQAMGYVRFRKADGESDFSRQARQKEVMLAIKGKLMANPNLIPSMAGKTEQLLAKAFTGKELGSLVWFGKSIPSANIKLGTVPVKEVKRRNAYYQLVDSAKLPKTLRQFGLKPPKPGEVFDEPAPEKAPR